LQESAIFEIMNKKLTKNEIKNEVQVIATASYAIRCVA